MAIGVMHLGDTTMNDNTLCACADLPEWVWEIVERHDLGLRADSPLAGAIVLLTDAADDLTELSRAVHREQALTGESVRRAAACFAMIADALKLAPLCASEPSAGTVTEAADGTLTWSATSPQASRPD